MKHFGDITKINGAEVPTVDIITGGSPCQDLSVAGKRAGLAGERSGLFMEQMRIVEEMREHDRASGRTGRMVRPRYMVWENVPGAFSSGKPKGADFAAVIEEIIKVAEPGSAVSVCIPNGGWPKSGCYYAEDGAWSIAWRVHDAQFWGVPQRRKRISLVADFGGMSAPEVLFERKGLSRDSEPCGEEREGTAATTGGGVEGAEPAGFCRGQSARTRGIGYQIEQSPTIPSGDVPLVMESAGAAGEGVEGASGCLTGWDVKSKRIFNPDGKSGTLNSGTTEGMNIVPSVLAYGISSYDSNAMKSPNPHSGIYEADTARTLDLNGGSPACNQGGIAILCLNDQGGSVMGVSEDVTGALRAEEYGHQPVVAFTQNQRNEVRDLQDVAGSLAAEPGMKQQTYVYENHSQDSRYKPLGDVSETVSAKYGTGGNNQPLVVSGAVCVGNVQLNQISMAEQANTLNTMHDQQAILCGNPWDPQSEKVYHGDGAWHTLYAGERGGQQRDAIHTNAIVRRLTPLECERLQGYPDGWTNIGEWVDSKGKKHKDADSPRYKALGNSIALPFWQWLAKRISAQYERTPTMASLFDGIGGFPLVFARAGAIPVWASEIEEFPIAVTKIRFPEEEQL